MNKVFNKKRSYAIIAAVLVVSMLASYLVFDSRKSSASKDVKTTTAKERLQAKRNETLSTLLENEGKDENEVVRVIVTLKSKSVAEGNRVSNYNSKLKSKEKNVINNQKSVIAKVEKLTGNKVIHQSGYLVNSFSINATRKQMKKIAKLDGVKKVSEAIKYKTTMATAVEEGNVKAQWESKDYGYTGEGVVVAVLDTGVNYRHKDMVLDKGAKTKYTKEQWKEKIKLLGYGDYFSEKVPFGYDYSKGINEALTGGHEHGYHVSGIVAANGEVVGVARNAQIVGLKVLSDEGWGYSDDIVKGIEDATKLGVDVINMSLGYEKAVVSDYDFEQVAINNASKAGIICCISAGNSGTSAGYGDNGNILNMKDTTTVGTPVIATSSLGVASAQNVKYRSYCTGTFTVNNENITMDYIDAFGYGFDFKDVRLVNVGTAADKNHKATFKARKVKDKIAVVQVGESTLNDKVYKLSKAGAKGIILVDDNETIDSRIEFNDWYGVPVIIVNKIDGEKLLSAALKSNSKMSLVSVDNSNRISTNIYMSSFSSWGPTNELGIKPEITAPGGNIKSPIGGEDNYAVWSGTSMASPFVAGSEAIMINALKARGINLKGEELSKFLKNSMINTADVITDPDTKYPYSVRYQGAGMVDVYGAVDNNVLATYNGEAKIELGELTGSKTVDITLANYGKKAASYSLKESQIYTDNTENKNIGTKEEEYTYNILPVESAKITYNVSEVTVPAGGKVTVKATVNLPSTYNKNSYVEAFVLFEGKGVQNIGMPVLGFNGNWSEEAIIDKSVYDEGESIIEKADNSYSSLTSLIGYSDEYGTDSVLGIDAKKNYLRNENNNEVAKNNTNTNNEKVERITRNAIANGYYDGTPIDPSDAIEVKVGDIAELPNVNKGQSVIYKLSNKKKTGCKVKLNADLYPVVTIYDKKLNVLDTNLVGYQFLGEYVEEEFSLPRNKEVYVEIQLFDAEEGMEEVEFEKTEYREDNDYIKIAKEDKKSSKEYKLKVNRTVKMKNVEDEYLYADFIPKEDGYYTFDIQTPSGCETGLYEYIYNENKELVDGKELFYEKGFKRVNREVKISKGSECKLIISANNSGIDAKDILAKVKVTKTNGDNAYTLDYDFNGQNVAFSPNEDDIRDGVTVALSTIRNAKEVSIKVLNDKKEVVRTIANTVDVAKISYNQFDYSSADFLINPSTGESVYWDGTLYNKKTGEFEKAKEGQYYIQVESKVTKNSTPQVITMPVKIDNVDPTLNKFEVSRDKDDTIVTFNITDNNALSSFYYLDIYQENVDEEDEDGCDICDNNMSIAKTYVETDKNSEGDYIINLGNIDDCSVTMMLEDEAGNEIIKSINADEESTDEDSEDEDIDYDMSDEDSEDEMFELCKGVYLYNKLEDGMYTSIFEERVYIGGECSKDILVSVEGCETEYDDEPEYSNHQGTKDFSIEIPVNEKETAVSIPLVVTKNGEEIFSKTYNINIDRIEPTITVLDNKSINKISKFEEKDFILLNKSNTNEFCFQVKIEDNNYIEDSFEMYAFAYSSDAKCNEEYEYLGNGLYNVKTDVFKDGTAVSISVEDESGNYVNKDIIIYTAENEEQYNEYVKINRSYFDINISESEALDKDSLNEDGTYTITGSFRAVPEKILINGERVDVNPNTKTFEHNIVINKGCTYVNLELVIDGEQLNSSYRLFYDEINVKLTNLPKANKNGVISTNKEVFNLAGTISSYMSVAAIDINGDNMFSSTGGIVTPNGKPFINTFDYKIKLVKGMNVIKLDITTIGGFTTSKILKVNYK